MAQAGRPSKGMTLTGAGARLYERANDALLAAEKVKLEALQLQNELIGELKVGIHTDFDFMLTGQLYSAFQKTHPKVTLHFLQTSSYQVARQLRTGELDVGFMFGPEKSKDTQSYLITDVPMSVVAPPAYADRIVEGELESLIDLPWIYTSPCCPFYILSQALFADSERQPEQLTWVDSEDAVRELVKSGVGVSILRTDDAHNLKEQGKVSIWCSKALPSIPLSFVCSKKRANEPAVKAFLEIALEQWGAISTPDALSAKA